MSRHAQSAARVGTFVGPTVTYGLPVAIAKPPDNIITPVAIQTAGGTSISSSPSASTMMDQTSSDLSSIMAMIGLATG